MARPERFERPTPWFVAKYSIHLSYGRDGANYIKHLGRENELSAASEHQDQAGERGKLHEE